MDFAAVNLRYTNERQEGMVYGAVPMTHFNIVKLKILLNILKRQDIII